MIDRLIVHVLEWAAGHHDEGRYSPVAIVFHWTMAALVTFQLAWGWWMGRLPVGGDKIAAHDLHDAIGVLMLVLAIGRGSWRMLAPGPINDADKPGWESTAARITHYLFYTCLFGLPLTGWAMISATAREQELSLLTLPWPLMPFQDLTFVRRWQIEAVAEWMHWGLIVTLMLPVVPQPTRRRTRWQRRWRAVEKRTRSLARRLFGLPRRR